MRPATHRSGHILSRRTVLRGAGVLMALPFFESLRVLAAGTTDASGHPKRLALVFMGCGINPNHWWARGAGADMEFSRTLAPLAPFRTKLNVINGLVNKPAVGVGIHPGQTGNILSGVPLAKGAVLRGGISMDQVLANTIGRDTLQPSLVLGCEQPVTGYHETNFSMAYSSYISWQSEDSRSTACSRTAAAGGWRASSTGCATMPRASSRCSAPTINASSRSTWRACATWRSASTACAPIRPVPQGMPRTGAGRLRR